MKSGLTTLFAFLAGLLAGLALYHAGLKVSGQTIVSQSVLAQQQAQLAHIADLEQENLELTEELFRPRPGNGLVFRRDELPYDAQADAKALVTAARQQAREENKFLMVTFGANWCLDCRTLHHRLNSEPVASYAKQLFEFAYVDVGKFNRNRDVAASLGVSLTRGIPVAVFFDQKGKVIGTTNDGQLEPARHYSSTQILKFVRDVAERSSINAPDSVE